MQDRARKSLSIIKSNRYMVLSTCKDTSPWVAPLAYAFDTDLRFYWYSATHSRHSEQIAANGKVAVAIFDSRLESDEVDGLQMEGRAFEVEEANVASVSKLYWDQSFPDAKLRARWMRALTDFIPPAIQRFYCFEPQRIWKVDPRSLKIDKRLEVPLSEIRQILEEV